MSPSPTSAPTTTSSPVVNVAIALGDQARERPAGEAIVFPRRGRAPLRLSCAELEDRTAHVGAGLQAVGIARGTRVALMVPPSPDFFALTFALFRIGAVPVFIDPGMGLRHLGRCLAEAAPTVFIGVPKAHVARALGRWASESVETLVTVDGPRLGWGGHRLVDLEDLGRRKGGAPQADTRVDEIAALLFTSGSTGPPKGAVYTHGTFDAQVKALGALFGFEPGEVDLPTFPLFGLFGPAFGMTAVIPQMDFTRPGEADPRGLIEAMETFGVTTTFGSPALLDRLGRHLRATGTKLPRLRRVISAGAPVPPVVMERVVEALSPGVQVFTPYGATESLPVACIGSEEVLGETAALNQRGRGTCVGRPVPGLELAIIKVHDRVVDAWSEELRRPTGEIGEVVVRGAQVTQAYHARDEATKLSKIPDARGAAWHRMGDLGYLDDSGRLWFCGRKAHRVRTAAGPMDTIPCEGILNTHPDVRRSALVGVPAEAQGDQPRRPIGCLELEAEVRGSTERRRVVEEVRRLAAEHETTAPIEDFLVHESFPVDIRHQAKIFREKLAAWAEGKLR